MGSNRKMMFVETMPMLESQIPMSHKKECFCNVAVWGMAINKNWSSREGQGTGPACRGHMLLHWFHMDLMKWILNGKQEALSWDRLSHQNSEDFWSASFLYQFLGTVQHGERRCTASLEDYLKDLVKYKNWITAFIDLLMGRAVQS